MAKRKELTVRTIVVYQVNGQRVERNWDDIPEAEQKTISRSITDRFMAAAGFKKVEQEPIRA